MEKSSTRIPQKPVGTTFKVDVQRGIPIIKCTGDIDVFYADQFEKILRGQLEHCSIVVDLSEVTYFDASSIGILIRILKIVKEYDGNLVLVVSHDNHIVRTVLRITKLDQAIFPPQQNIDDALDLIFRS